jgi:hypothetical protein
MGNPTYSGLELIQAGFRETIFPLPDFRTEICGTQFVYSCGLSDHEFVAGIPVLGGLHLLAKDEPYEQPQNVVLCAKNGEYGLRFVEECFLQDACAFNVEQEQSFSHVSVVMEPYGYPEFLAFVRERYDAIRHMARYGKAYPSLKDRLVLLLWPERYVFPGHFSVVV